MAQLQPGPCALSLDSGLSAEHSGSRTPILPVKLQARDRERPRRLQGRFPSCCFWLAGGTQPLHHLLLRQQPLSCCTSSQPWACALSRGSASARAPGPRFCCWQQPSQWVWEQLDVCLLLMRSLSSRTRAQAGTTDRTGQCDLTCEKIRKCNPAGNHRSRNSFPNERTSTLWKAVSHTLTVFLDGKSHANTAADVLKKMCVGFLQSTITASFALSCQKLSIRWNEQITS